jgi:hypothetical protein
MQINEVFGETSNVVAILVQQQREGLPGEILGAALFQM